MTTRHSIHYTITPINPQAHLFEIVCRIESPKPSGQVLYLPAWIPGSYMIRDFAKNIVNLNAVSDHRPISITKQDKQTWLCAATTAPIEVTYTVYAWDMSVRTAHLDTTHGFFNGSSVFLAVQDQENAPVQVTISLPEGDYQDWRVATTLTRVNTKLFSAGTYHAEDYQSLIDHPVEMGTFDEIDFTIDNIPHHIILTGQHRTDLSRLTEDVEKICRTHVTMFGELPEMERYMFLLTIVGDGYGGLEHRSSTALICSRKDLPVKKSQNKNDGYVNLLGLFSHEYFHTWNIKKIKPKEFIPYQLQDESYTKLLWAFEGITSYYDELGLIRSGVIDEKTYLQLLGKNITRVLRGTGRHKQTLLESSYDAWTRFYKQDENAVNSIVSYYVKGALFALCLDLMIRTKSDGKFCLDHIMRALWLTFGKKNRGLSEHTIRDLIKTHTGVSLDEFFNDYLNTTQDLPLETLFESVGLKLEKRATDNMDDLGGKKNETTSAENNNAFNLGVKLASTPLGAKVLVVYEEGAIQKAGIASGDIIIAINKLKTSKEDFISLLADHAAGETIILDVFRRDELMTFSVLLQSPINNTFYLTQSSDDEKKSLRISWLSPMAQSSDTSK